MVTPRRDSMLRNVCFALLVLFAVSAVAQDREVINMLDRPPKPKSAATTGDKLPSFKCGDELTPGISYQQLAECYESERAVAKNLPEWYLTPAADAKKAKDELESQGSFTIDGQPYPDINPHFRFES